MIPWTVACQAPLFMGFSRQEYWSGLSFPSPEDHPDPEILSKILLNPGILPRILPYPGIKPGSSALQAGSLPAELPGKPLKNFCLGSRGLKSEIKVWAGLVPPEAVRVHSVPGLYPGLADGCLLRVSPCVLVCVCVQFSPFIRLGPTLMNSF